LLAVVPAAAAVIVSLRALSGAGSWAFTGISSTAQLGSRSGSSGIAMRGANIGDLMGAMGKMQEGMKKLPELQAQLKLMPSVGTALGGKVKVTITGDLAPKSVEIDESVMSEGLTAQVLADAVFMAMKEAHAGSMKISQSKLSEFYGDMGMPMPGQQAAAPAPAPPLVKPKPKEELGFDPAGIGSIGFLD